MNQFTNRFVHLAINDVGIRETSPNNGPEIAAWRKRITSDPTPGAWCAVFAWCKLDDVCREFNVHNPIKGTRSVHTLFQRAKDAKVWTATPGPGMIFGVDHGGGKGHCGITVEIDQLGTHAVTVEGNSNAEGSRDADRVALRQGQRMRGLSTCTLGFIDLDLIWLSSENQRA